MTWELVDQPEHRKIIGLKWVFRTKLNVDGPVNKHKARLVVKGYTQIFGVNYFDTFAPLVRLDTIRLLLTLAAQLGWKVCRMDVKSAFLNGFVKKGHEDKVYRLRKALYGLKQAPRAWYGQIDGHLLGLGFEKSRSESTLYVKHHGIVILIVSIYVDDVLVARSSTRHIEDFKNEMMQALKITNLSLMSYFVGIESSRVRMKFSFDRRNTLTKFSRSST